MTSNKVLLQINVTANWGSTGKIAEDIGLKAMDNGWKSYIAYGRNAKASKSELIRIGSDLDLKVHGLESRIFDNHGLASQFATRNFVKQIEKISPTIIHLHNIHGYYLNYKILFEYLSQKNIPIVWTMHDCWPFTGHCGYFDYAQCEKWKKGCSSPCPCKGDYPQSLIFDACKKNWDTKKRYFTKNLNITLVPVSYWLGNMVKSSFLSDYPVHVIHNGIDINTFYPGDTGKVRKKYGLDDALYVVGVASVWDRRKGFEDCIKLKKYLPEDIKIVLVGLGQDKLKKATQNGIIGIPRTENVKELVALYSGAISFINPSYEDNFPTTNIESLACGTPVVTYRTGGSPEAIDDQTGIVVEKGDVKELSQAILDLSSLDRKLLGFACRTRAIDLFDKEKCFKEYIDLYNTLL